MKQLLFIVTLMSLSITTAFSQNGYWCNKDFKHTQHGFTIVQDGLTIRYNNIETVHLVTGDVLVRMKVPYTVADLRSELQRYNDDGNGDFIVEWKISNNFGNSWIPVTKDCSQLFRINQVVPGQFISYDIYYVNSQSKIKVARSAQVPDIYEVVNIKPAPNQISNSKKN